MPLEATLLLSYPSHPAELCKLSEAIKSFLEGQNSYTKESSSYCSTDVRDKERCFHFSSDCELRQKKINTAVAAQITGMEVLLFALCEAV